MYPLCKTTTLKLLVELVRVTFGEESGKLRVEPGVEITPANDLGMAIVTAVS